MCGAREFGGVKSGTEVVFLGSADAVFEVQPKDLEVTRSWIQRTSWVGVSRKKCIRLPSGRTGRESACVRTTPRSPFFWVENTSNGVSQLEKEPHIE